METIKTIFAVLGAIISELFKMAFGIAKVACRVMLFFLFLGMAAGFDGIE